MNGNFEIICSMPEKEYVFATSGEIREARAAIIARERRVEDATEIGLALIDSSQCVVYYMESDRIIQLYRAMKILSNFSVVTEDTLVCTFLIASRTFSSRTKYIIDHLEKSGFDVMDIQSSVFSHEIGKSEFNRMMEKIKKLNIEIDQDELAEEQRIRYIPIINASQFKNTVAVAG